jgi:ribosomal protein S18 acetylase RimI-like enzyme
VSTGDDIVSGYCGILEPDQWRLIRRLRLEALNQSPKAFLGELSRERLLAEDDWRKTFEYASWHAFFVTRSNIVGIAKSSRLAAYPDERYIESFWVRDGYRHKQVGRRMLDSIVAEARNDELRVVRLSVLRSNCQAIAAFKRLGLSAEVLGRSSSDEVCLELPLQ